MEGQAGGASVLARHGGDDGGAVAQQEAAGLREELDESRRRAAAMEGELKGLHELQRKLISGSCGQNKDVVLQVRGRVKPCMKM